MKVKIIDRARNTIRAYKEKGLATSEFFLRIVLCIFVAFFMAMLIEIGKLGFIAFFESLVLVATWIELLCVTAIISCVLAMIVVYIVFKKDIVHNPRKEIRITVVSMVVTFVISMLSILVFNTVLIMPLALSGLLIATLVGKRLGLIVNILINQAFYISYLLAFGNNAFYETSTALLTGVIGGTMLIMIIPNNSSRIRYILSGLVVAMGMAVVGMISSTLRDYTAWKSILIDGVWSFSSTILSVALFIVLSPIFEIIFNAATNTRLAEISSFNSPLLMRLSKEAPGTFNHSILVADLAELCAIAIGANAIVAKACGYYHDIGKLETPSLFIENQFDGVNPHDDYIPEVSVKLITNHAIDGYKLIKEAHLPEIIGDVCLQHHGTTAVNYFYYKVKSITENTVNKELFVYPGPKPQSKIPAIIMIVDTVEAAARSREGEFETTAEFRAFVHSLIRAKAEEGQFDECDLTLSDLAKIEETLVEAIPSMSHKRIKY